MAKKRRGAKKRTTGKPARRGVVPRRTSKKTPPRKRKPTRRRRSPAERKDARDLAFAKRAKAAVAKKERAEREQTIRLVMKRLGVGKKKATKLYDRGLRRVRRKAIFSPADVARDKTAKRFKFRRTKDGKLDTRNVYEKRTDKRGRVRWVKVKPSHVERVRAAYLREARYRQIAEVLGVSVPEAKKLVRDTYRGETRNALVQVVYQRLSGRHERRDGPVHYSDVDRLEEDEDDE